METQETTEIFNWQHYNNSIIASLDSNKGERDLEKKREYNKKYQERLKEKQVQTTGN